MSQEQRQSTRDQDQSTHHDDIEVVQDGADRAVAGSEMPEKDQRQPQEGQGRPEGSTPSGSGTGQAQGKGKSSKPRDTNDSMRQKLLRERHMQQVERAKQKEARAKRKAERQAKLDQIRKAQEQRRIQEENIQKERRDYQQIAQARAQFERTRAPSSDESSSDPSEIEEYEDLPGETSFLQYFKMSRENSPDRIELMAQEIGPDKDTINRINEEILYAENMLGEGKMPEGEDLEEFLEDYQNIMQRITFLCHTQGKYAQLRQLRRAKILLELDVDLKQRAEGLLQVLGKLRQQKRTTRRDKGKNRTRRFSSTPAGNRGDEATPGATAGNPGTSRRTRSASDAIPNDRAACFTAHAGPGPSSPGEVGNLDPGRDRTGPRGSHFGTFMPGNPSYFERPQQPSRSGSHQSEDVHTSSQARPNQGPGVRASFGQGRTQNGAPHSAGHANHFARNGGSSAAHSGAYVPYYLKRNGEGAMFYNTLPNPWNILPEHVHTPLTQVPTMLKAGCFTEFSGSIQAYRTFRGSFITGCHMLDLPITTKYMVLKGCLDKHQVLNDLLNTTEPSAQGYRTIIVTLEERFGHGGVLLNHHLQRLTDLPRVRETSLEDMDALVDTARGYEAARVANGAVNAQDPTYFNLVKSKLTDRLRREYAKYCRESGIAVQNCDVSLLINWIKTCVAEPLRLEPPTRKSESNAQLNTRKTQNYSSTHGGGAAGLNGHFTRRSGNTGSGNQPGPLNLEKNYSFYSSGGCPLCKHNHILPECPEFLSYNVARRFDVLRELNHCFKCLQASHIAANCPNRTTCPKCKGEHHVLLHYKRKPPVNNPNYTTVSKNKNVSFAAPAAEIDPRIVQNDYIHRQDDFINHARQLSDNKDYSNYLFACRGDSPVSLFFQWATYH